MLNELTFRIESIIASSGHAADNSSAFSFLSSVNGINDTFKMLVIMGYMVVIMKIGVKLMKRIDMKCIKK